MGSDFKMPLVNADDCGGDNIAMSVIVRGGYSVEFWIWHGTEPSSVALSFGSEWPDEMARRFRAIAQELDDYRARYSDAGVIAGHRMHCGCRRCQGLNFQEFGQLFLTLPTRTL